jgi:hypothetical protein
MQTQLTPQLARQPTTAEQARAPQFKAAQFYLQTVDCISENLAVVGKQTQVRILLLLFVKHRQRLTPGRLLLIVDFAEIENGSLHRLAGTDAMVFYDAEVAMVFTVFLRLLLRRNMLTTDCQQSVVEGKVLGLHSTVFREGADENTRLNNKNRGKKAEKCPQLRKCG